MLDWKRPFPQSVACAQSAPREVMAKFESLKHSYRRQLYTVLTINVALCWGIVVSQADFSTLPDLFGSLSIRDGVTGLIVPIVAFVLDGLLSADVKARVVYWRRHHPLPGSRAFSDHVHREPRADPHRLAQKWGAFPNNPTDQNRLWYRIYMSVDGQVRVHEAHRSWLFARDLTAYSALFVVLLGSATVFTNAPWGVVSLYLSGLAIQYLAAMTAARTFGVRFVRTVLAVASQDSQGRNNTATEQTPQLKQEDD